MKQSVWYVVLTYRPQIAKLTRLLRSLENQEIVLVDNTAKEEKSGSFIFENSHCRVIRIGENLGYTGGMNRGGQFALSHGANWVVFLNSDIVLSEEDVNQWNKKLQTSPAGLVGPFPGRLDAKRWTSIYPSSNKIFDYLSGSYLGIHKNVIRKIGMFYEPYFIYYEEIELCIRAKKAGFPLSFINLPHLRHHDAQTFGTGSFYHEYYLARNHLLFIQRNAPLGVQMHEILRMPITLSKHYQDGNVGALTGIKDFALRKFGPYRRET